MRNARRGREASERNLILAKQRYVVEVARAFYQTLTTNGFGGYFEVFMGDQGALEISESAGRGSVYRDTANAPDWKSYVKDGLLTAEDEVERGDKSRAGLICEETIFL